MWRVMIMSGAILFTMSGQLEARDKGTRLWNLTTATISSFQLSPAGQNAWGKPDVE